MIRRSTMLFPVLLLAAAACSGTESSLLGSDVTDPTMLTARFVPVGGVTVAPESASVETGKSVTLAATIIGKNGQPVAAVNSVTTRWVSSDTMVAKVSGSGVVIALQPGTATIKVTSGTESANSTIQVHAPGATTDPTSSSTQPVLSTTTTSTASTGTTTTTSSSSGSIVSGSGQGVTGVALLSDDFTHYATTADLQRQISTNIGGTGDWRTALYRDGSNAQLVSIDPTVLYNGHPTMKYTQPGGTSITPELWVPLPAPVTTMWLRAKIRFGPGYTTTGTLTNASYAYKLLGWQLAGVDGSGRLEITNTTQYDLYWGATTSTGTTVVPNDDAGGGPNVTTEWQDGAWYNYIIEYTVTGANTATARAWISRDGQTPQLVMTRYRTATAGNTMPSASGICLGLNFNQIRAANQNQALWYGQWEVVDGSAHADPFGVNGGKN